MLERADRIKPLGIDTNEAAWEMMKSKEYQNAKCDYGAPDDTEFFFVAVPRLNKKYTNEAFWLFDGEMRFRRYVARKIGVITDLLTLNTGMIFKSFLMFR